MILELNSSSVQRTPFLHSSFSSAMPISDSNALLEWLEDGAPWRLRVADFYEQYEFSITDAVIPDLVEPLFSTQALLELRIGVQDAVGVTLNNRIDITAHKLTKGQRIRIHNDYIPGQESHRLLIQLNRGWTDEQGGALIFFGSNDPNDVRKIFRPIHNTGVLFEISPTSLHAVSPITTGERFTLVFSFYRET